MQSELRTLTIPVGSDTVSALLLTPDQPHAALVLAHGAGAGMNHPFLAQLASGLAARSIATLRFQFPFMETGARRPDSPVVAQAAVRAAAAELAQRLPAVPAFAGGKSFGGRMTSQAQALGPLPGIRGIVFVGFPLHPADKPSSTRADHLAGVDVPMLFLQGTRDALAEIDRVRRVVAGLQPRARLEIFPDADHSFHVRRTSGTDDAQVMHKLVDAASAWMLDLAAATRRPADAR